ncbi:MAG: fibronectin type III domain-containing protein [Candidatus Brocadiaceae bacterium]|nr:fibronectin type III domain-containing protein [Candidatus Brocadiaceae bacterium]
MFPIATTSGREFGLSAAFDGTNYLVGIQGDQKDHADITAQLVSQTGALVGSRISVPRTGGVPSVAFDGNNYLMVWGDDANYPNDDIYGQFISTAGTLVGTPFAINQAAGYQDQSGLRSVIFDGLNYFVVWGSAPVRDGCNDEYGQFVKPNGQLLGSPIKINQTGCGGGGTTLTFDGTRILAVWLSEWTSGGTRNGCSGDDCEAVNVIGQFITKSGAGTPGALLGNNFWISESPVSKHGLSVSFNGTNYLVVFPEDTGLWNVCGDNGCNYNISAYLVTTGGTLASSKIAVTSADGQQRYPFVVFDGTNYLVTWIDMTDTTNWDIYGQYISNSGTIVGSPFPVDTDNGNQFGGFTGLAVDGKLFGMVNNVDTIDGKIGDVYGMFLSVGSATSPKVTTGAATHITKTSAKLSGTVNPEGLSTTAWFEYSKTSGSYTKKSKKKKKLNGTADLPVSFTVFRLSPGTKYYYRLAAENEAGASHGSELTFTTLSK